MSDITVESEWDLKLPKTFKTFDYSTINDVILHISYTAEYDETYRTSVEASSGALETTLSGQNMQRLFSLRQEFSQAFHALIQNPTADTRINLSDKHFPIFLNGKSLEVSSTKLVIVPQDGVVLATLPTIDVSGATTSAFIYDSDVGVYESSISGIFPAGGYNPQEGKEIVLSFDNLGSLATELAVPTDPIMIDVHKLKDIYLMLEFNIVFTS